MEKPHLPEHPRWSALPRPILARTLDWYVDEIILSLQTEACAA